MNYIIEGELLHIIEDFGDEYWIDNNNDYHREDAPAYISGRSNFWYKHGQKHRLDGPAVSHIHGLEWWVDGKLHRLDGPAIDYSADDNCFLIRSKQWWIEGIPIKCENNEEFLRIVKMKALL
jgi:hypothetical protein